MTKTSTKNYSFNGLQKIFIAMTFAFVVMIIGAFPMNSSEVFANEGSGTSGTGLTISTTGEGSIEASKTTEGNKGVNSIIATSVKAAKILSGLVIAVALLVIVWAGFKYALSQGDPKATEGAKSQIISAGMGMAIAIMAIVIVQIFGSIFGL